MINNCKKFIIKHFPIIFLLLFYTAFHIAITPNYWDDEYFRTAMDGSISNLFPFLYNRYSIWSPRIIIEFVIGILSLFPYTLWKILDLLIILLLYKNIEWFQIHLFHINSERAKYVISFLLCAFPFSIMACTGWLATTTNYLWVISFGLYAINKILKCTILKEKLSNYEKILMILTILYSCNFESVAVLMLTGLIVVLFYQKFSQHERLSPFLVLIALIIIALLTEIILCPGNEHRLESDIKRWMPDFAQMNLLDKLRVGIVMAFMHFVSIPSPLFFILNSSCLATSIMKKGTRIQKLIAACPVALDILWTSYFMINYLLGNKTMTYQVPNPLLSNGIDIIEQLTMLVTIAIWFTSLLYSLYWIYDTKKDFFLCLTILLIGCVPEVIVGMSATVTNSMLRTVIYLYLSMILIIICLWKEIEVFWMQIKCFRMAVYFTLACGIALNAIQITRHILIYG